MYNPYYICDLFVMFEELHNFKQQAIKTDGVATKPLIFKILDSIFFEYESILKGRLNTIKI